MRTSTVKSLAAITLTGAGTALVIGFQTPDPAALIATTTAAAATTTGTTTTSAVASPTTTAATGSTPAASSSTTPAATASPSTTTDVAAAATYADGTWIGAAVTEPWGTFQVQAVVSGGQITDVVVVSAPQDGHSSRINDQAVPILTQATVAAQSADIDMLSGATWTSQSYITSLQAALDAAHAAADTAA